MAVSLCVRVSSLEPELIQALLVALARYNADLYATDANLPPPWSWRWKPDGFAGVSTLRSAKLLSVAGEGSCGELAAAYAGWLYARGRTNAEIVLIENDEDSWHVIAQDGERVLDPQVIGGSHAA